MSENVSVTGGIARRDKVKLVDKELVMGISDPIADMLTRIRNANSRHFKQVDVLYSRMNQEICRILKKEGFILGYEVKREKGQYDILRVYLKYPDNKNTVIRGLRRISKPGRRIYVKCDNIPKVLNGYGVAVLSTSKGIMTDREAVKQRLGGELLLSVW